MTQVPSIEQALQRADEALAKRMDYVREALEVRQALIEVEETNERERAELEQRIKDRTAPARREDRKAYHAAVRGGWTEQELRNIGLSEIGSKTPAKRRTRRKPTPKKPSEESPNSTPAPVHHEGESDHV